MYLAILLSIQNSNGLQSNDTNNSGNKRKTIDQSEILFLPIKTNESRGWKSYVFYDYKSGIISYKERNRHGSTMPNMKSGKARQILRRWFVVYV